MGALVQFYMRKIIILFFILLLSSPTQAADFLKYFTFSKRSVLKLWKEKLLSGRVEYKIIKIGEEGFLRAKSENTASGIYYEIDYDPKVHPYMSWKWRVDKFPVKDPEDKEGVMDDFAARIYVIFPAKIFIFSRCLEYVWDDVLPKGTITRSPLSGRIKIFVLRNGKANGWQFEERNIFEDYLLAFGKEPEDFDDRIGAIAFMTDTDDSESSALANFDEMKIGYKKPLGK